MFLYLLGLLTPVWVSSVQCVLSTCKLLPFHASLDWTTCLLIIPWQDQLQQYKCLNEKYLSTYETITSI